MVPEHERKDYSTALEQLYRYVSEMDCKMHIYASFMKEEVVRKLIAVVCFFTPSVWYSLLIVSCTACDRTPSTLHAVFDDDEVHS